MSDWTHDKLKSLGYHRHPDGNYYPAPPPQRLPDPIPQHDPVIPLVKTPQTQTKGKTRINLRIERISTKLQDFDNFVGGTKPLTDQLRYSGLIPDDNPESIDASYHQQKCRHKKDEKTIVTIIYHNDSNRQDAPQSLTSQSSGCPTA
jgi:hypothetical protein